MTTLNPTQSPLFHRCDLNFTLSAPSSSKAPQANENACFYSPFRTTEENCLNELEFCSEFDQRVKSIGSLLHHCEIAHPSDRISEWAHVKMLSWQISNCVNSFNDYRSRHPVNIKIAQAIYAFAQDLNRHDSLRRTVWADLPKEHRSLLHRLSPWTAELQMLYAPINFQWLGDGCLERARKDDETITDFGRGRLFRVLPPLERAGVTVFPLADYPSYHLLRTSSERTIDYPSYYLNVGRMGRIHELFDVHALARSIEPQDENARLYKNQLITLFTRYRAALCRAFNLSVALPRAMGKHGEWSIWPNARSAFQEGTPLSEDQLVTLHRFFLMEKKWKINFLSDDQGQLEAKWALCEEKLEEEGVLPLPAFIVDDIAYRHKLMLARFQLDMASQDKWNRLEKQAEEESHRLTAALDWLQKLLDSGSISTQDLLRPSHEVLHQICLFKQNLNASHAQGIVSDQELLDARLLCLRKAAFLPHSDLDEVNQCLQSLLHDEMIKNASQTFLNDFKDALSFGVR